MKKLWQKNWQLDHIVEAFETKGDLVLDQKLLPYDIFGSLVQAQMLEKIGILTKKELTDLTTALLAILKDYKAGGVVLGFGDEDMHTKLEVLLTQKLGDTGKKIHTGRSRNDQIATVLRLYAKDKLLAIGVSFLDLSSCFLSFAKNHGLLAMPGYTHMQKAMPSSLGIWATSFIESILDDISGLQHAYQLIDVSPLGSGAGYGVPLPLDREATSNLLAFATIQINPLYCQNSRGKFEATILSSLIQILLTLNRFASDVLLFTTSEFGFLSVANELTTGSSIMPQKKNIDVAELLRSKVHSLLGNYTQIVSLVSNLTSGYNRDYQDLKKPLVESLEVTLECISVATILLTNITPNASQLKKAMTPELFATHKALALVSKGIAFRDAYAQVGKEIFSGKIIDVDVGQTGQYPSPIDLSSLEKKIKEEKQSWYEQSSIFNKVLENLTTMKGGEKI